MRNKVRLFNSEKYVKTAIIYTSLPKFGSQNERSGCLKVNHSLLQTCFRIGAFVVIE